MAPRHLPSVRALGFGLLMTVASQATALDHGSVSDAAPADQSARPRNGQDQPTQSQVIAEAERLRVSHGGRPPRGSGGVDDAARRHADESFAWLARAGARYRGDALVSDALMRTYGAMGDYYNGAYPGGAWRGYVGANQWARRRWLYGGPPGLQRDLDRYSQAWATVAYANGSWFWRPPGLQDDGDAGSDVPGLRETALEPVALPQIDERKLSAAEREAWGDVRTQFGFVSGRVHQARVLLEGVVSRLGARGLSLNAKDGAIALSMQGFMVDAADLIKERDFTRAKEALTRADYERTRLRGTTGQ